MNKITILAIGAVFAVSMIAITALEVEAKPPAQSSACPVENVQHWNKITWSTGVDSFVHQTEPTLIEGRIYEIVASIDPSKVPELKQIIADKLNDLEYTTEDGGNPIQPSDINREVVVLYSTICAE